MKQVGGDPSGELTVGRRGDWPGKGQVDSGPIRPKKDGEFSGTCQILNFPGSICLHGSMWICTSYIAGTDPSHPTAGTFPVVRK